MDMKVPAFLMLAASVCSAADTFVGTGLPAGAIAAFPQGVSANGQVVIVRVTFSGSQGPPQLAYRWNASGGFQPLGSLPGSSGASNPIAISADGAVIVGSASTASLATHPFRWTAAGGMQDLGVLLNSGGAYATSVSADGTVVVGPDTFASPRSFRWTQGIGTQDCNELIASGFVAQGVSGDGLTVVGTLNDRAVKWTSAGGVVDLGYPRAGSIRAYGLASNTDGTVISGYEDTGYTPPSDPFTVRHAFLWDRGVGSYIGMDQPRTMNSAASVILGDVDFYIGETYPCIWTPTFGPLDVRTLLTRRGVSLTNWELSTATGVSADRRVLVGYGSHLVAGVWRTEGWIATLDQPLYCDANCDGSTTPPVLNVSDFTCFLNRFAAQSSYANCDGSASPPVFNILDFVCFLNKFGAGCGAP